MRRSENNLSSNHSYSEYLKRVLLLLQVAVDISDNSDSYIELHCDSNDTDTDTCGDRDSRRFYLAPLPEENPSKDTPLNSAGNSLSRVFKDICTTEDCGFDDETNELPAPGLEENPTFLIPSPGCKFRPSILKKCSPKIEGYIMLAICRQKLHDVVLKEWTSSYKDEIFCQFLTSWIASKKHSNPGFVVWCDFIFFPYLNFSFLIRQPPLHLNV